MPSVLEFRSPVLQESAPHLTQFSTRPVPNSKRLLLKLPGIRTLCFGFLICAACTQHPTMRASVTNLLLATNASRIIVYKESIEGETFGHLQIHSSLKQAALYSARTPSDTGAGRVWGGRKARRETSIPSLLPFCCLQRHILYILKSGFISGREDRSDSRRTRGPLELGAESDSHVWGLGI